MAVKVKELKDDALVEIKVNKTYYLMMKAALFYVFMQNEDQEQKNESIKKIMENKLEDLNEWERTFHTITLFLAEVEKQAAQNDLYIEKEVLEPGDDGYVTPTPE